MSKLYDVISRLEDVASQEDTGLDAQTSEILDTEPKERSPWLRLLLICLLVIALGAVVIGGTAWLQKWFTGKQAAITPLTSEPVTMEQPQLLQVVPPPVTSEKISSSLKSTTATPTSPTETQTAHLPSSQSDPQITEQFQGTMSVDIATQNITVESLDQLLESGIFDIPQFLEAPKSSTTTIFIHELDIAEAVGEPTVESVNIPVSVSANTTSGDIKARSSRWLHQAELYRHKQEWEAAILLYKRVWDISQSPDVANNLAAALIEVNRPEEAHTILKDTISTAPDDRDIKQNLRIVERILEM